MILRHPHLGGSITEPLAWESRALTQNAGRLSFSAACEVAFANLEQIAYKSLSTAAAGENVEGLGGRGPFATNT